MFRRPVAGSSRAGLKRWRSQLEQAVEGDGEADSFAQALVGGPGVDAEQISFVVVEAAATVAGVDRRLGLDDPHLVQVKILRSHLRDHALGVRPAQPIGIADGEDRRADLHGPAPLPRGVSGLTGFCATGSKQSQVDLPGGQPDDAAFDLPLAEHAD